MSAICGIIHFDGRPVDKADLETMVASSPGRGPDGSGYYTLKNSGFAHLAFDVTAESVREKQPLVKGDLPLVLVADVRLDNREELAGKLSITKHDLHELTDTELLLLAYQKWSSACVSHLLGDFVFAVWNQSTRELFLARDALGAHSVTFCSLGNSFYFASETTAILDLPAIKPGINEDAVLKTLAGIQLEEEETFFGQLHYLAPANCMLVSAAGIKSWNYWSIKPGNVITYPDDNEYTDHFLELMEQAVACRLRSTGPVGISLSGGYDSTLLAAIAASQLSGSRSEGRRLKSFSYVFDHFPDCDESEYIKPVVEQYDLDATYVNADQLWTFAVLFHPASTPCQKCHTTERDQCNRT